MAVLITGAGGYLGRLLARRYRDAGEEVLEHGRDSGDLAGPDPFAALDHRQRGRITAIVHAAAVTRFDVARDVARSVNVEGTAKVTDLARTCPRLESLGILSTIYSTGLRAGPVCEQLYGDEAGFANDYEWSKWEAEQVVAGDAGSGLPWRVLRVATVIADDDTGAVTQHNAFHDTLKLWFHGLLPLVPGDAATPLYLVTGSFVADAVLAVMDDPGAGGVYHLAHAAADSLTLGEVLDVVAEAFEAVESFRRRGVLRPLLGDEEAFRLLAQGVSSFGGGLVRQSLQSVVPFARQLFVAKLVGHERLRGVLGARYAPPDPAEVVRRTGTVLVDTNWGRHAVA